MWRKMLHWREGSNRCMWQSLVLLTQLSVLRGMKEKYEGHHGVRIEDRAFVVADQLSSRYITGMYFQDYHDLCDCVEFLFRYEFFRLLV